MKKFFLIASVITINLYTDFHLIDKIDCVVCGPERNTPLVDTDVTLKRNLDGRFVPLQQQIQQDIISQQIVADKMPIDPSAAEKYIESMKKQNNLTDSDLAEMFEQIGRTFTEGLGLLNDQYFHEMFMHYKFKSQILATDEEIKNYYDKNPEYTDGWCELQVAYIDYDADSKDKVLHIVEQLIQGKEVKDVTVEWSSPMKIQQKDLAKDKHFIFSMDKLQIKSQETKNSFELYKLIDKKEAELKPLESCRSIIVEKINKQQLQTMLANYNQEVRKFIDIINLNQKLIFADE